MDAILIVVGSLLCACAGYGLGADRGRAVEGAVFAVSLSVFTIATLVALEGAVP